MGFLKIFSFASAFLSLFIQTTLAVTVDVTVKGVVIAKPKCTINSGQDIKVSFGDLNISDINGVNYGKRQIPYNVICSSNTSGANGLMKVKLQGVSANFGDGLLSTDISGLAIKILDGNSQQIMINEWLNFTYPDVPELYAVTIKNSQEILHGGDFSSSASLLIDIQ